VYDLSVYLLESGHMDTQCKYLSKLLESFEHKPEIEYSVVISNGEEKKITWKDLENECQSIMNSLKGIEKGVVLIFLRHSSSLHGTFFGTMMAGHTPSFMPCTSVKQDPALYWASHQKLLNHIKPTAIITSKDVSQEILQAKLELGNTKIIHIEDIEIPESKINIELRSEDEIALLQHSSGTTGLKKGVALTFDAIVKHAESYSSSISITEEDTIVSWLPLYHDMGLMACMIMPAYTSTPVIHMSPFDWVGKPHLLFEVIEKYSGTLTWMPNFAFEHMALYAPRMPHNYDISTMRAFISCSEVCRPESFDKFFNAFNEKGVEKSMLHTCYAMAETVFATSQSTLNRKAKRILVNQRDLNRGEYVRIYDENESNLETPRQLIETGSIIEGLEVKIVDEDFKSLPELTIGEISISGTFIFDGYYRMPDLTKERVMNGSYMTKDLGFFDSSGRLYVLGRVDDLIIVQGRNIYAHQVEALVSTLEGIKPGRISAFGIYDPRIGSESMIIVCEVENGQSSEESQKIKSTINKLLQSTIEVVPKKIRLVTPGWLVKTSSGKVGRKENKEKHLRESKGGDN
jgi:fatty-acyl-CoA synthase